MTTGISSQGHHGQPRSRLTVLLLQEKNLILPLEDRATRGIGAGDHGAEVESDASWLSVGYLTRGFIDVRGDPALLSQDPPHVFESFWGWHCRCSLVGSLPPPSFGAHVHFTCLFINSIVHQPSGHPVLGRC